MGHFIMLLLLEGLECHMRLTRILQTMIFAPSPPISCYTRTSSGTHPPVADLSYYVS